MTEVSSVPTPMPRATSGQLYPAGAQGYVNPKYLTMGVTYAPPGGSASSVSYQTTNVVGNTSTNTDSFENSVSVTASTSAGGSFFGFISGKVTTTQSSGWTQKTTSSNEFTALRRNLAERAIDGVFNERGFSLDWAV